MKTHYQTKRSKLPMAVTLWADLWSGECLGRFCFEGALRATINNEGVTINQMKLYLRITYGLLKPERSIDELDRAIIETLAPFGFKQTGSSVDSMVRDLSYEADSFQIPEREV